MDSQSIQHSSTREKNQRFVDAIYHGFRRCGLTSMNPRMGILKPCCIWWWPWWGAAACGGGAMVGSLGEEAVLFRASAFFSLLAIGAQRSAAQDCQGEEARLERTWRQDLKGQDRDWKGTPYMGTGKIGGDDGWIVARSAGGAPGSRRRSGILGMKRSALSGVSWSYQDVGN